MIVIVDYGLGNLSSVLNMFRKIGLKDVVISGQAEQIAKASHLLLPGVGAFDAGMSRIENSGLIPLLNKKVLEEKIPVLGICLGMQMLTRGSEEGVRAGLNWIDGKTVKFIPDPLINLRVPHMGWEYVNVKRDNPLLPVHSHSRFYFVHSYHVVCDDDAQSIATASFGGAFTCIVNKGNVYGTQFHPEKSLHFGMEVLSNFSKL